MQTQTIETNSATDADFDAEIASAEARLQTLQSAADDAEAEAARWRTAFEREPTQESHTNAAIFVQRAKIAQAAAETFERETLNPIRTAKRQAQLNAIDRELDRDIREAKAQFTKAGNTLFDFVHALEAAIEQWGALHPKILAARAAGVPVNPISLQRVVAELNDKLSVLRGGAHELERTHAHISFADSNQPRIALIVNRPAAVPTPVR